MANVFQFGRQRNHFVGRAGQDRLAVPRGKRENFLRPIGGRRQLVGGVGQRTEVEPQLAPRVDQPVALAEQKLLAFDDDRQLGQRPLHSRHTLGQGRQLALDGRR